LLNDTIAQPGHGAALGAINLQRQQVIPPHPDGPRRVEVADDAVVQFKRDIGGIFDFL
jgi:hypothetical protein